MHSDRTRLWVPFSMLNRLRLSQKLFVVYAAFIGLCAYFIIDIVMDEIRPGVRQTTEETLVDTANLLAEFLKTPLQNGTLTSEAFLEHFKHYGERELNAEIWGFKKHQTNHRIYVTDHNGIVLLDSHQLAVGQDYSRWNDVYKTLQGEYGARSSPEFIGDASSSVMYVAAPIKDGDDIIGVVSVAKPNRTVQPFIQRTQQRLALLAAVVIVVGLALGALLSWWLGRELFQLRRYANAVSAGERAQLPLNRLHSHELKQLASALETMRKQLDGKAYVEHYVQTFAHELKSPLAGIMAAAELLQTPMDAARQQRFIDNIHHESERLEQLIHRLLQLAHIEQLQTPGEQKPWQSDQRIAQLVTHCKAKCESKHLSVDLHIPNTPVVIGDPFLLDQAVMNLLDNAIDFSTPKTSICITATASDRMLTLTVSNQGATIPEFAFARITERFYSLPRPGTGKKSTGLGLSFVQEVALLHGGRFTIANTDNGVNASLLLPIR